MKKSMILLIFTSHYVSINSHRDLMLLNLMNQNLHPTMYLLIPVLLFEIDAEIPIFTSHYVSINSRIVIRN